MELIEFKRAEKKVKSKNQRYMNILKGFMIVECFDKLLKWHKNERRAKNNVWENKMIHGNQHCF